MFDKIWKKQIYILLLVIIGIVVFIKVLDFGFVWDDNQLYLNKGNYPEDGRLQNISKLWQPGKMPMYAPVTYTMWGIIAQLSSTDDSNDFKLNPKLFHFVNLLFHILNSVLILLIISRLLKDNLAAFIAGLIFLLHPIQVESVAWISEFRGLLAGFFGFLAVYIHLTTITGAEFVAAHKTTKKNNEKKNIKPDNSILKNVLVYVMLILAMLSKPTAIVFPVIIFILDYYLVSQDNLKKSIYNFGISIVLILPIVIISMMSEETASAVIKTPFYLKPIVAIDSFMFYLGKIILPLDFSPVYGRTVAMLSSGISLIVSTLIFMVVTFSVWYFRKQNEWLVPAYLITIIGLLPVSGIIDFYYQSFSNVADRYFYISMFGLIILIGNGLVRLKKTNLKYIIVLIVGIFLSYQTTSFSNTWVNELSLWNRVIEHNPEASFQAYLGRGEYYLVNSSYSNAIMDFTKAVELNKNEYRCYYNRANAYLDLKQYDKAVRDYSRALLLNPKDVNAFSNRGIAYYEMNQMESAVIDFKHALSINSDQPDLLNRIGVYFASMNKLDSAVSYFEKSLKLNSNDNEVQENLKQAKKLLNQKVKL